jgi:single-strand DNA-binding protein
MNNITIVGRLGRDAERKTVGANGTALLEFSLAEDVGFGDNKTTNWWNCKVWGKQAEGKLADYLLKGAQVAVTGAVVMRKYDSNGETRVSADVRVGDIQLVGSKPEGGQQSAPASQNDHHRDSQPPVHAGLDDSDLPF